MEDSNFLLIDTSPESPEMDRTDKPPALDPHLESLSHKLRAHYRKRFGHTDANVSPTPPPPEIMDKLGILVFLLTILYTLKLAVFDIMPQLYAGRDQAVYGQQCLACFLFIEIMVNWLGIRYADSSFRNYIRLYGNPRLHIRMSSPLLSSSFKMRQQALSSDSVSSVLLPPVSTLSESGEMPNKKNDCRHSEMTSKSLQGNFTDEKTNLEKEAEVVNEWMFHQIEQCNSKSIADLISVAEDSTFRSSQEERRNISEPEYDAFHVMKPKPVVRRCGETVTESYPYWSWAPCYACRLTRPPRCHHCPICKCCVLKRDHHCFFAGSCVGYSNQRFFIVFVFWACIGCLYATLHIIPYMSYDIWSQMSYADIFFPVAALRWTLGYLPFHTFLVMMTLTFLVIFMFISAGYFLSECRSVSKGLTSFEKLCLKKSLEIKDTRRLTQKMRAVFGRFWLLNFLFPMYFFIEPEEDPIYWPHIQVVKH